METTAKGTSFLVALVALFGAATSHARIMTLPHFVTPGEFAIGGEMELTLTHGAGVAGTVPFTEGVNELVNVGALLGTGGGPRGFRFGGNVVFDFFPDLEGQP